MNDQLVLAEVDRSGNFTGGEQIPCVTYSKTQEQAMAIVSNVTKEAVAAAVRSRKPLVIELLDFENKKAAL